ncbi:MAG: hypothetical protein H0X64_02710 [Gemmatimonadaceae bacterium]|nr:hypothetical protein [Gemmatimonadaceae bacterium]
MRTPVLGVLLVALTAACQGAPQAGAGPAPARDAIRSAADIMTRVAAAYPAAPRTAAFTQANTVALSSGDILQRQRVLVRAPDAMRIDNLPLSGGSGAIYIDGRAISYASGRRAAAANERNPLMLLGFSVFAQPAAASVASLSALGVRTSVIREETFDGAPVWVIGAAPGDSTSNQVWIDSRRWIPLRIIQSVRSGTRTLVSDTRFSGHAAPAPTVPRVIDVYRDGRRALRGTIDDLRVGVTVPGAAFDTTALRPVQY